jgi:hypothetical protein
LAKIVLDIPTDKMPSFLNLIVKMGIDKHAIRPEPTEQTHSKKRHHPLHRFSQKFLLFDWEFYDNELEFE